MLVDTQVAANAPVRFLVAGMGDGLATWVEARAAAEARKSAMADGAPTMAALSFAKLCWDTQLAAVRNRVGLPTTLAEVGLAGADRDALMRVATAATVPGETIHNMPFPVDAEILCDAMIAADAYGRAFRGATGAGQ